MAQKQAFVSICIGFNFNPESGEYLNISTFNIFYGFWFQNEKLRHSLKEFSF